MNTKKIYTVTALLFFILAFIQGCSDSTTSPTQNNTTGNVSGKVIDQFGASIPNATVLIGSSIAVSGGDGSFTINNVTTPYNAKVLVNTGSNPTGILYQGITTLSPQLFISGTPGTSSASALNVTIPVMGADQRAIVIFTDNSKVNISQEISTPPIAHLNIKWPSGNSISGKIIVLTYTFTAGQISLFNKYGEMPVTLSNSGTTDITFSPAQLSVTPQQTTVSGTLNLPSGYTTPKAKLLLGFGSTGNIASWAIIGNEILGSTFNFTVPAVLTSSFSIGIEGQGSGTTGEYTYKYDTVHAGETGKVITLESAPSLTTPPNAQTGVDTATNFSYTAGSGTGIYLTIFNGSGKTFIVVSNSTSVTIPNFSSIGLGIGTQTNYNWSVQKFNFASVNDFVSGPAVNNTNYNSTAVSGSRTFTTGP